MQCVRGGEFMLLHTEKRVFLLIKDKQFQE